jgi:hypothetical protein
MVAMVQFNPELAKSTPSDILTNNRPGSMYESGINSRHPSISSRRSMYAGQEELEGDEEVEIGMNFTYIPSNPKKFYKRLLEMCLRMDLDMMMSEEVNDDDEVSLGILSPPHIDLLNECALRWRIGHPHRAACFLDLVRQFYERNDVPMECVPEALQSVAKVLQDTDLDKWPTSDVRCFTSLIPTSRPI